MILRGLESDGDEQERVHHRTDNRSLKHYSEITGRKAVINKMNNINGKRKAGERVYKPKLRLLRPPTECSTIPLIFNPAREVKEMLRDMNLKRKQADDSDTPDAA